MWTFKKKQILSKPTTWNSRKRKRQLYTHFFLRSYVQSHVFSIVLQCFSMVTRWTIQFEIIQKLGWNQVLKKKKWSQMRSKTRFRGVGRGIVPRGFPTWPQGKGPFSRFLYFPHVDKYFLLAIFLFHSCWQKLGGFSFSFSSLANFFRFDPRAGLHLFWFITILSRSFIKIDERNGDWGI